MSFFLENCFGCIRLRTGVLILGYLHLIAVTILCMTQIITTINFYISSGENSRGIVNLLSFMITFILSYMVTIGLLIYGATKGNRHCMLPFIAVTSIECAFIVCYEVLCCLFLISMLVNVGVAMIFVAFNVFFLWIILSHHQEIKKYTLNGREDDEISIVNASSA